VSFGKQEPIRYDRFPRTIATQVARILPDVVALRHDIHAHPELSGSEERTARVVAEALSRAGIAHQTNVGGTHGVVAVIKGGAGSGRTFALRGDMDALPIVEENEVAYRSTVPGAMHACGHDGHTANLLGAALVLNELRAELHGRVKLIFQPAEETVRGADALVAAGVVDNVDAIVMLHGWPNLPVGQIGVRNGPVMASADGFTLTLRGKGGHGAYPHDTIDPIMAGGADRERAANHCCPRGVARRARRGQRHDLSRGHGHERHPRTSGTERHGARAGPGPATNVARAH
jgi:amidohydrolase/hippurate hydrolase